MVGLLSVNKEILLKSLNVTVGFQKNKYHYTAGSLKADAYCMYYLMLPD